MLSASIADVLRTEELAGRSLRRTEDHALNARVAAVIMEVRLSPLDVLKRTAAEALLLCAGHSAGVSLVEGGSHAPHQSLRRHAVVGPWASYIDSTVPRNYSPDGLTIDQNATQLFCEPGRFYPHLHEARPAAAELLLVPFDRSFGHAGVAWVVLHDASRHFDQDDARRLQALTQCASASFSVAVSVQAAHGATRFGIQPVSAPRRRLSVREEQVCLFVARGHTNKEIGALLGVSGKSVETYRARVADKLNLRSRADYVQFALAHGWLRTPLAREPRT